MNTYPDPIVRPWQRMDETSRLLLRGLVTRAVATAAPALPGAAVMRVTDRVMEELTRVGV